MTKGYREIIHFLEAARPAVLARAEPDDLSKVSEETLRRFASGDLSQQEIQEIAPILLKSKSLRRRLREILQQESSDEQRLS